MSVHHIALEMLSIFSESDKGLRIVALRSDVFHVLVGVSQWRGVDASAQ